LNRSSRTSARPLDGAPYRYLVPNALEVRCREGGRTLNVCVVHAVAVNRNVFRESLGLDVVTSEDGRLAFPRSLLARGLDGVKLVTSDAHSGLVDVAANAPAREGDLARFIERVRFFVTPENYTNVEDLARRIRRRLADGLREAPGWIAFAREKAPSHTCTR
jgi:Transposase, Mutator family